MPRIARFTIDNGIYHVMTRGNNRQKIFQCDSDNLFYLKLLKKYKIKHRVKIYHYILMTNHAHIIIAAPTGKDLSNFMKGLNVLYTVYYRKNYGGVGHFFQDRFKSFVIQSGIYLLECGRYIELNPVKAGIVKFPGDYRWSSYPAYAFGRKNDLVNINPEYESLGINIEERQRVYREFIQQSGFEKRDENRFFRVGAYGSKKFLKDMKVRGLKSRWSHSGPVGKKKKNNEY